MPLPRRAAGAPSRYNARFPLFVCPAMFTPSSHDVRRFFCEAYRKHRNGEILTPMDAIAADWIDQPRGIRAAHDALVARRGEHDAHHEIMECLGEMIWASQRNGVPPDTEAYIECVRRRAFA